MLKYPVRSKLRHTLDSRWLSLALAILTFLCMVRAKAVFDTNQVESTARVATDKCVFRTVKYYPSTLESYWIKRIKIIQSDEPSWTTGCDEVRRNVESIEKMLQDIDELISYTAQSLKRQSNTLSSYEIEDSCSGERHYTYIEPLISFLRHPKAVCFQQNDHLLDKSYLVVPHQNEIAKTGSAYTWLFDVGASTYREGAGGASQSWFVDTYRNRGIEFDRIYAWEAAKTDPEAQWAGTPLDVKMKTSWYNIPINVTLGHADNPLTFIKRLAKEEDYVVLKLDIDTPTVEIQLVKQLMVDEKLLSLVDEFYFEHHVSGSPMQWYGWGNLSAVVGSLTDLHSSYSIFAFLRGRGIRAHSWV